MRHVNNFHPEWGYLAPAPSFKRTTRIVLVAAAVGATAGAAVVLSLTERPTAETSVSARTLARPVETVSPPASAAQAMQPNAAQTAPQPNTPQVSAHLAVQTQSAAPSPTNAGAAASELSVSATTQPPMSVAAMAEVPAATDAAPGKLAANPAPATTKAPPQRKTTKKPHAQSHYASRGGGANSEMGAFRLFNDQSLFGANGYGGAYHREQRWGGYYPDEGFSSR